MWAVDLEHELLAVASDLAVLGRWAERMATEDEDVSARPLWALIAAEVSAYQEGRCGTVPLPGPGDRALFDAPM